MEIVSHDRFISLFQTHQMDFKWNLKYIITCTHTHTHMHTHTHTCTIFAITSMWAYLLGIEQAVNFWDKGVCFVVTHWFFPTSFIFWGTRTIKIISVHIHSAFYRARLRMKTSYKQQRKEFNFQKNSLNDNDLSWNSRQFHPFCLYHISKLCALYLSFEKDKVEHWLKDCDKNNKNKETGLKESMYYNKTIFY